MKPGLIKRDCFFVGMGMGIVLPALLLGLLLGINWLSQSVFATQLTNKLHYLYLLSMTANLLPMRYYLAKLNYEKTGMGLLLITIAGVVGYFYLFGVGE